MKKNIIQYKFILLCCILFLLLAISCRKVDAESFTPETPGISFVEQQIEVSSQEDTIEVAIKSNLPWRAKTSSSWATILESNGQGNGKFKVAIAKNKVTESRTAEIIAYITEDARVSLKLIQAAGDPPPSSTRNFYVKTDGDPIKDGLSWANATTLDHAIAIAVNGDHIHIAEGTYIPQTLITNGTAGNPKDNTFEIAQNIHLIGGYPANATTGSASNPTAYPVTLSGNDQNYHVVVITAIPATDHYVSLEGLTITQGHAGSTGSVNINGVNLNRNYAGGMIISNAKASIENCRIINNRSDGHVPGLFLTGQAEVTLKNSSVSSNEGTVATTNGGGIWNDGSTLYIFDSEITGNRVGGVGGGLYSLNTSRVSYNYLYNVTIANNAVGIMGTTRVGAGIYSRERSFFLLVNSTIYGNNNNGNSFGAGVTVYGGSTVNIVSSTISNNTGGEGNPATVGGSGLFNNNSPTANTVNIYNSIISGNKGYGTEIGGANISIQSSIIANTVYDYNKTEMAGQSFDPLTMFGVFGAHGGYGQTLPLLPTATPALSYGMSALQLQVLAANLSLNNDYYLKDQNHHPRNTQSFMGAAGPF